MTFLPDKASALALQVLYRAQFKWLASRMYRTGARGQNYLIRQSGTRPVPWAGPQAHGSSRQLNEFAGKQVPPRFAYTGKLPGLPVPVTLSEVLLRPEEVSLSRMERGDPGWSSVCQGYDFGAISSPLGLLS